MTAALRARNLDRQTELATRLEVADGLWSRFMGLMGRPALEPDTGLWLTGTNGIHMMFMRFAIDAVFLGQAGPGGRRGAGRRLGPPRTAGLDRSRAARPWRRTASSSCRSGPSNEAARPSATGSRWSPPHPLVEPR